VGDGALLAYLLSGGCPVACAELAATGRLPEYVAAMVRDWIYGECVASGRDRASLLAVLEVVLERGGTPLGQSRLARECGLANNTVAAGYVELLADLTVLGIAHAWDAAHQISLRRKRAKYPLINLLAAVAWDGSHMRSVADYGQLAPEDQGRWLEWLVAQELWRRSAVAGEDFPEYLHYWQGGDHELDFVVSPELFVEVKRGRTSPLEYAWFPRQFPAARLLVIGRDTFDTEAVRGLTLEDFLLEVE
jgi:uncharacterized protein